MTGWYSKRCALSWNLKATKYNRIYFQLRPSTLPTEETGFGLLPTVKGYDGMAENVNTGKTLIKTSIGFSNIDKNGAKWGPSLNDIARVGMLPTPKCQEARGNASVDRGKANLTDAIAATFNPTGKSSQLSPRFVAEMMGFPVNWTELPFQSGEPNPSKDMETQSCHK
jgi:hypothetical protein